MVERYEHRLNAWRKAFVVKIEVSISVGSRTEDEKQKNNQRIISRLYSLLSSCVRLLEV
jgi:hypothetical protein